VLEIEVYVLGADFLAILLSLLLLRAMSAFRSGLSGI
jgi:hypothetical protein